MKTYSFSQCTRAKLEHLFDLRRALSSSTLEQWLKMLPTLSEGEKFILRNYQELLLLNGDAWNERELSQHFIGPVFGLARFTELYRFNFFAERSIGATLPSVEGDVTLSGEPDGLIATGYWEPQIPMFAFSEYKRTLDPSGDPAGQALAAMVVGQTLNQKAIPIYGCYIVGHDWHFLVLEEKQYVVSHDFSAKTEELFDIFRILKALKLIIMELTAEA